MAVVKYMGVPIDQISTIMGTSLEDIGSLGGDSIPDVGGGGGDSAVTFHGKGSSYAANMEKMSISSGGMAAFGSTLTCHYGGSAASNGEDGRAIVGCGYNTTGSRGNTAEYFNISTEGSAASFGTMVNSADGTNGASNSENDRMVSGGGNTGSGVASLIEYFTFSTLGNSTTLADLSINRSNMSSASNRTNERAVYCGGWRSSIIISKVIDSFTMNTASNATDWGNLESNNWGSFAVDDGENDTMLVCGGATNYLSSTLTNRIETITITTSGSATNYANTITEARRGAGAASNRTGELGVMVAGATYSDYTFTNTIDKITINTQSSGTDFGDAVYSRLAECEGVSNA